MNDMGTKDKRKKISMPGAKPKPEFQGEKIQVTKENIGEVVEGALDALEGKQDEEKGLSKEVSVNEIKDAEIISEATDAPISSSGENGSEGVGFDAWRRAMGYLPPDLTGENRTEQNIRDPKTGRILPGFSLNPSGRPEGAVGFKTMFEKAVKRLAELNKLDPDMIEIDLVVKAIAQARGGDYRFYKDMADRLYGKPTDKVAVDHTTGGMPIQGGNQITFIDFSGQRNDPESKS